MTCVSRVSSQAELSKVDRTVGPALFLLFIIVGMLFLLNVFIAILSFPRLGGWPYTRARRHKSA